MPWLYDDLQPKGFYDLQLSQHCGRAGVSSWEGLSRFPGARAGSSWVKVNQKYGPSSILSGLQRFLEVLGLGKSPSPWRSLSWKGISSDL